MSEGMQTPQATATPAASAPPPAAPAAPEAPAAVGSVPAPATQGDSNDLSSIINDAMAMMGDGAPEAPKSLDSAPTPPQAAPPAAPVDQAAAAAPPGEKTLDDPATPPAETAEEKVLGEPEEYRPQNLRERLLEKQAKERAQSELDRIRSESERQITELRQQMELATHSMQRAKKLRDEGDLDGALKEALGVDNFTKLQEEYLQKKGVLPKKDPKVAELEARLEAFETEKRQQEEQRQAYIRQQQAYQQEQQELQIVTEQMKGSEYGEIQRLAEVPGAAAFVRGRLRQDLESGVETDNTVQYYKELKSSYLRLRDALVKALPLTDPGGIQATTPAQPGVPAAVSATQPLASPPVQPGVAAEKGGAQVPTTLSNQQSQDVAGSGTGRLEDDSAEFHNLVAEMERMLR